VLRALGPDYPSDLGNLLPDPPSVDDCSLCSRRSRDAGHTASFYLAAPILKIFVAQTWQEPSVAGRPFFIVIGLGSLISR